MDYVSIGARHLGFDAHPEQLALGRMLDGAAETNAVCWPRRAGKTTGVWGWLMGRCAETPDTQWVTSAQSGVKARDRFLSMARLVDRYWPEDDGGPHIYRGAGHESFEFVNHSRISVVAPKPENFRGDGVNVYLDEPQEFDLQQSLDLQQAVYPLFDTFDGQVILSGTPGLSRSGWFWDALQGQAGQAVSWYSIPDHLDVHDPRIWADYHPGLKYGLTTLPKLQARHDGMADAAWRMEYGGQWPVDVTTHALDLTNWNDGAVPFDDRPARVGVAYDVAIDSSTATLAIAWRSEGLVYVEVVAHRLGTNWLASESRKAWDTWRQPITHDSIGANADADAHLQRERGLKIDRLNTRDIIGAANRLAEELGNGNVRHFGQADLTAAVENTGWRNIASSGRAFTQRNKNGAPINPLVAASLALWAFDKGRDRQILNFG